MTFYLKLHLLEKASCWICRGEVSMSDSSGFSQSWHSLIIGWKVREVRIFSFGILFGIFKTR